MLRKAISNILSIAFSYVNDDHLLIKATNMEKQPETR